MPAGASRTRTPQSTIYRPTKTVAGFAGGLGRRSAPAGIGAYYQTLPYKQIAFGNYDAVGATANKFDVTSPTDQELLSLLQSEKPVGPYTPWAERIGDFEWAEISTPDTNRLLFIVSQDQLDDVQKLTGEPVTAVAILSSVPSSVTGIESAFDTSRYEWLRTEGLYAQSDVNDTPEIVFLHWGSLRPMQDMAGRESSEEELAQLLSGKLTFPVEVPRGSNDRYPPNELFENAIVQQFPPEQARAAIISPQEEIAQQQAQAAKDRLWQGLLLVGVVGGGGYLLYRWLR